jgi:lipopolysaccharide/colanic/teichoic acid biosynthesis glycosyltransferase
LIGNFISSLRGLRRGARRIERLLLTQRQFNRELVRERIRASRRGISFCIITFELSSGRRLKWHSEQVSRILLRNLRATDEKARIAADRFAVLLVDTPEMGGRVVVDRLQHLFDQLALPVAMQLKVHDPQGFDHFEPVHPDRVTETVETVGAARVHVINEEAWAEQSFFDTAAKRSIDVIGATMGLVFALPILLMAIIAIRLTSPGPALYRQVREGRRGKAFTIYKLRTMVVDAERLQDSLRELSHRDGPAFKLNHDPRVTAVGKLLRATCMDELPQLWNVFKGEMSLVGPRPLPLHESRACNHWQRRRLDVLPGLTCFWQVNKERVKSFDEWMRLDLEYVDRRNLWIDAGLVYRTLAVALLGRGSQ